MKKWLILTFCTILLVIVLMPSKSLANEKVCRLTGLFCPQAIPGTSWVSKLGPVTSIPLRTYEQLYFQGNIYGYRTNILIDVDFNQQQIQKLRLAHAVAWYLTKPENQEQFKRCIRQYARTNLFPEKGISPKLSEDYADNLVALINKTQGTILRINYFNPPKQKGSIILGNALLGTNWVNEGFLMNVNPEGLDMDKFHPDNFGKWAATILHEMMHNIGYNHPDWIKGPEDVEGSLIYEADWCLGRKNADKEPNSINLMLQDSNRPSGSIPYYTD